MNRGHPAHTLTPSTVASSRERIERMARRLVPSLADFCIVHLVTRTAVVCVTTAHTTRGGDRILRALMRTYRIARDDRDSAVAHVVRSGQPLRRTSIQLDAVRRGRGRIADLHQQLATRSALVVPILVENAVAGTLSLCYSQSGRTYAARDAQAAARVAERLARLLVPDLPHAALGVRPAARHARQGTTVRKRVAARN